MAVTLKEVVTRHELKQYIDLPAKIYGTYLNWVPTILQDEWAFHDPKKNLSLSRNDTIKFLAIYGGQLVGRVMGIIHHEYNAKHDEKTARFFHFDCIDDQLVAKVLIEGIANWAVKKGMSKLIGPYGFSDKDPQGLQVEGFEHLAVISTPSHPRYLVKFIENLGFTKEVDCVSYCLKVTEELPVHYQQVLHRVKQNKTFKLIEFKSRKQLKPYIIPVFRLVNETYSHLFGFVPMTELEMTKFAAQYLPILDPAFVKVIVDQTNNVIAFTVAMPDLSRGIQKAKGRLFPFGIFYILNAMKTARQLDLLLGAVKPGFRKRGLTVLMADAIFKSAAKRKMTSIDSHLILETNEVMRAECENIGGILYKRFRVFKKEINLS
jgi:hypothetical protein